MSKSQGAEPWRETLESLAKFILEKQHGTAILDFDKQVERLDEPDSFLLKIFATDARLIRVYKVAAGNGPVSREEQPFDLDVMDHFRRHKTVPPENYYCAFIRMDIDRNPASLKIYPMPMEFSQI